MENRCVKFKNVIKTLCGYFVKIKFKSEPIQFQHLFYCIVLVMSVSVKSVDCNRPPRFLLDGQTEIVLRLKEGINTPIGSLIHRLKGYDPDGDPLQFGLLSTPTSDVIRIESVSQTEANVYLNRELDRETIDEYSLVLTLTDGHLRPGSFITHRMLILVEDVNDNAPVFRPYPPSVVLREDAPLGTRIVELEAVDADVGPYGQVIYRLDQENLSHRRLFELESLGDRTILRLIGSLDYEKQTVHQVKVLAIDRAKTGRINSGTAVLLVKVEDVEDQPPEFVSVTPVVRIEENSPVGTSVLRIVAIDGDRGVDNPIEYSLTSNDLDSNLDVFSIEKSKGVLFTTGNLDREALSANSAGTYVIQITATEVGSNILPAPSSSTEVTVIVTDVNDESPTFTRDFYECEIGENSPVNTPVTFLGNFLPEVHDHDQGINGTFLLSIEDSDVFEIIPAKAINEATFIVRVKNNGTALDYERTRSMNLTVLAREAVDSNPKSSRATVQVTVSDRNDNFPEFTRVSYHVSVQENCDVGTTVAWVQALDDDSGNFGSRGVRYTGLAGSIEHMLDLHPVSGIITVKTSGGPNWDREQFSRHYLTVEARDNLGFGNRNSAQIVIDLEDVNDNAPAFLQGEYEARLLENEPDFKEPVQVFARDSDLNGTRNSEVEYLLFGELSRNFSINPTTGTISVRHPVDFEGIEGTPEETVRVLSLTVRARDLGTPSLFNDVPFYVYVEDINDNTPVFERESYNVTLPEDLAGGVSILQVRALDLDGSYPNNHVVYRIQSGAEDKFSISSETGVVSLARGASLDPDLTDRKRTRYSLEVLALDGAPGERQRNSSTVVDVTIADINNKAPTLVMPEAVVMLENTPVSTVIAKIEAEDLDETAKLIFKIDANDCHGRNERGVTLKPQEFDCYSSFHLDPISGTLSVARIVDRETVEAVRIGIVVEDVNSDTTTVQTATATLLINVEDVNDNSPKFQEPFYKFSVPENSKYGTLIGSVLAVDPDKNRSITYSMDDLSQLNKLVHLDPDRGDLVVANRIDREKTDWLNLTIKAVDGGQPPRSSRVEVFVQVLDENDNVPYFLPEPRTLSIPENVHVGREVARLEAVDADAGDFGKVTYLLDRLSSEGRFSLEPNSGVLRVDGTLDRERKANYLLVVEAWDNYQYGFSNGESRNAFKHLNVTILDVNDNPPVLHVPEHCLNITEFQEPEQVLITVHASDDDDPETPNGQVIIDIAGGNSLGLFDVSQINAWSANVKTTGSLRGKHGNYTLALRAQDLGIPSLQTERSLKICVTDYNDHAPEFISPPYNSTLKVPENATVGSALIQIIAEDEDFGLNGAVRYRLKNDPAGHWKHFDLQPVSGILELRLPLSRKKQKIYDIRIEAYDLGVPTSLSSDLDLTIYVSNIYEYQPQFTVDEFLVNFTENKQPESEIRKLPDTVDADEYELNEHRGPVCYFIVGGNEDNLFHLNPIDHTLVVTRPLDREQVETHLLLVKATEECLKAPKNENFFDSEDDTQLKVVVKVLDVNDNPPRFTHRVFTGGVSTATAFGTKFMRVTAEDADADENAEVTYYLIGRVQMTLTEGLENLQRPPFIVERETGEIQLNFDPQRGMKGYFDFMVLANDTGELQDMARIFIYLLREDQRVRFVLRQQPHELRSRIDAFRETLGNVTGAIVNVDEFKVHLNQDGTIDKTRTDLYLHLVDRKDNSILEVDEVLKMVDQNTERLDDLFKEFNVLDTQPGGMLAFTNDVQHATAAFWLTISCLFLLLLLLLCLALCVNQKQSYQRKLKAATATAYISADSIDGNGLSVISGRVPNTNKHSMEGSNPMWLKAYENEWFKNADDVSQTSEHDSLDENVVGFEDYSSPTTDEMQEQNQHNRHQNVYQTLPVPAARRLETTEL